MHRLRQRVLFQHCDPAGIVFYPRYFEMANALVEHWFDALGHSFALLHGPMGLSVPTAELSVTFTAPSRLGDDLDWTLHLTRLGRSSARLSIGADCGEQQRLAMTSTLVCVTKDTGRPTGWPADLRAAMEGST